MYDIDGNGTIERREMSRIIEAIYEMLGTVTHGPNAAEAPAERARRIFDKMDSNRDGVLSRQEFIQGCLEDSDLSDLLAAATGQQGAT